MIGSNHEKGLISLPESQWVINLLSLAGSRNASFLSTKCTVNGGSLRSPLGKRFVWTIRTLNCIVFPTWKCVAIKFTRFTKKPWWFRHDSEVREYILMIFNSRIWWNWLSFRYIKLISVPCSQYQPNIGYIECKMRLLSSFFGSGAVMNSGWLIVASRYSRDNCIWVSVCFICYRRSVVKHWIGIHIPSLQTP